MRAKAEKFGAFRALHAEGCFVMSNPWDVGSAVALQGMGFEALATTSSGFAWSLGRAAYGVHRDECLGHLGQIASAAEVPVNADFEGGFANDPHGVGVNVKLAAATGIAGFSIEDATGDDPDSGSAGSASEARSPAARGRASSRPPRRSQAKAPSRVSPTSRRSTRSSADSSAHA